MLELGNTYNKDCIEGLQQMINQNILVDCIITDPPYGKNHYTNRRKRKVQ